MSAFRNFKGQWFVALIALLAFSVQSFGAVTQVKLPQKLQHELQGKLHQQVGIAASAKVPCHRTGSHNALASDANSAPTKFKDCCKANCTMAFCHAVVALLAEFPNEVFTPLSDHVSLSHETPLTRSTHSLFRPPRIG